MLGSPLELVVPDVLEDLALGDGLAPVAEQELEQGQLPGGELDLDRSPPGLLGRRVEAQVARLKHRGAFPGAAAQQDPQPGEQHRLREWHGEVVVERLDLVPLALLGRKHEDRRPDPSRRRASTADSR